MDSLPRKIQLSFLLLLLHKILLYLLHLRSLGYLLHFIQQSLLPLLLCLLPIFLTLLIPTLLIPRALTLLLDIALLLLLPRYQDLFLPLLAKE